MYSVQSNITTYHPTSQVKALHQGNCGLGRAGEGQGIHR